MSKERLLMTIINLRHIYIGHSVNSSMIVFVLRYFFLREVRSLRKMPRSKQAPPISLYDLKKDGA